MFKHENKKTAANYINTSSSLLLAASSNVMKRCHIDFFLNEIGFYDPNNPRNELEHHIFNIILLPLLLKKQG